MKSLLKLCLLFGLFCMTTPMFAQLPDPSGIDYCDCVEGVQTIHDECNCTSGGNTGTNTGNTNTNTNTNTGTGTPNPSGSNTGGTIPEGNFPLVISWLECFFDPDCTP